MDEEARTLLHQILEAQRDQTELLRKYLPALKTRFRFSLLALLLLMTAVSAGLGLTVWQYRSQKPPTRPTFTLNLPTAPLQTGPTLNVGGGDMSLIADPPKLGGNK